MRYLTDVDFRIEVGGESLVVVAGVAVHDVEILYLVEMMLRGVCREHLRHTRVEAAAEYCREACLLEAVLVGPLPRVFEMCLVFWLIVGRVEIVAAASQASVHDAQVLIGQGEVDYQVGLVAVEQLRELLNTVGVHLGGLDVHLVSLSVYGVDQAVAFLLVMRGYHQFAKHVGVLCYLEGAYRGHASSSDH